MKNKLLTTALVSSMLGLGVTSATAQTTISGNLEITYNAVSNNLRPGLSFRGFGKESQINVQNKGKLSNGLDYAAGFSIELDGPDANVGSTGASGVSTGTGVHFENNYIDLSSGNTTFTISADHIQNPDSNPTMLAGFGYIAMDGVASSGKAGLYPKAVNSPYSSFGFGLIQTVPGFGKLSALYVPTNATNQGAMNDIHNDASAAQAEPTVLSGNSSESAIEIGFIGDFGVPGLTVQAFYNKEDAPDGQTVNKTGKVVAATYVTGPFSIAADWRQAVGVISNADATIGGNNKSETIKGKSIGLGYAISKDLTTSITRGKADTNRSGAVQETTDVVAIGYNLGAVTTGLQYKKVNEAIGVSGADAKSLQFRIGTKF